MRLMTLDDTFVFLSINVIREYKKMPQVITARTLNMMRQLTSVNAVIRYVAR